MTPLEALHTYFGYSDFRPLQREIAESVLAGNDTLALLPTGGGKSLCFQVPTLAMASQTGSVGERERGGVGLCLVVTPLIALMKDQVQNLRERGIMATAIYTGMQKQRQEQALDNCQFGPYRFLYVSPERLESPIFRERLSWLPIVMVAVDEAHCISQWGYDFRPSYLRIADVREALAPSPYDGKRPPVLALTATATEQVAKDIECRLRVPPLGEDEARPWQVFRQSFRRKELNFVVRHTLDANEKTEQMIHILQHVPGSAIVYVRNRDRTQQLAHQLLDKGISAAFYHAGLMSEERSRRQEQWKQYTPDSEAGVRVMVCTNAFGMGIDKADVRLVIHYDLPDSPEAYFQEAGRAGRDGQTAYAVLLFARDDKQKMQKRVSDNYPPPEFVQKVYQKMSDYLVIAAGSGEGHSFNLDVEDFCRVMHLPIIPVYSAFHLLSNAGFIDFEDEHETQPRVQIRVSPAGMSDYVLSKEQKTLLQHLMRHYPGVFTDLQYLYEPMTPELHQLLVSLAKRRIITYIPRNNASLLTLVRERQAEIWLPEAVYEQRVQSYSERLKAMVGYAEQQTECRQRLLLAYFGETDAEPCGVCDVCRRRK